MSILSARKWASLYALNLFMAGLLLVDVRAGLTAFLPKLAAVIIVLLAAVLNLAWVEKHNDIMEHEGVDASAARDLCRAAPYLLYVAGRDAPLAVGSARGGTEERRSTTPVAGSRLSPSKSPSR